MKLTSTRQKYEDALCALRNTAAGAGVHSRIMSAAALAALSDVPAHEAEAAILSAMPRPPSPSSEVATAIRKAYSEAVPGAGSWTPMPYRKPAPADLTSARKKISAPLSDCPDLECELWEASPIRIDGEPGPADARLLLGTLYAPDEILFVGENFGRNVKTVQQWLDLMPDRTPAPFPHFIPNPLDGREHDLPDGKKSFRCDSAVCKFRFAVCEFDGLPRSEQLAFFAGVKLPIAALIDTGGKSIHALVKVDAPDREAWTAEVEQRLFAEMLVPLGCDRTCRNESRLSRLPGHFRTEKGRWQRLLYLNPNPTGRGIL